MNTLAEIVEQLRWCGYTCEAGALVDNEAFRELERMAEEEQHEAVNSYEVMTWLLETEDEGWP